MEGKAGEGPGVGFEEHVAVLILEGIIHASSTFSYNLVIFLTPILMHLPLYSLLAFLKCSVTCRVFVYRRAQTIFQCILY